MEFPENQRHLLLHPSNETIAVEATMLSAIRLAFSPESQFLAGIQRFLRRLIAGGRMSIDELPEDLLHDLGLERDNLKTDRREADRLLSNAHAYRSTRRSS
ncbi:hypothetical protein J5N58_03250 [Rhizobium cremeum]|uniref:hypothetical protein n=1 Tax=Rhizobium cremeum TaxID=2813827 RepID=UPI0013AE8E37|nr:hypothetical protein [Rhizobium cremeum]MCJ7993627.1 hypothetical protein [Rhizobium cremeum]MCJ7998684.1 hypothetical protein [Rhizobium cremeum]